MIEHKLNQKMLQECLNTKIELKEEVIEEAKKNLENEGLYKEDSFSKEKLLNLDTSRKNSEDGSNESKNNEYFLKEFHKNMINEINFAENRIES